MAVAPSKLIALLEALPEDLARRALTHASWSGSRAESYERLAFLGDSVLELAISSHMYPLLDPEHHGAGELTKIRAQTVSGASCAAVAQRLCVPERLAAQRPEGNAVEQNSERVLASVVEAIIGACYLDVGYQRTAVAVVEAFAPELKESLRRPVDFKSELQERLARRGETVSYEVSGCSGPPHKPIYTVMAIVSDRAHSASGEGRSKKEAEQAAAGALLDSGVL